MITDSQGRPWVRLVHCGSELDVTLGMPSLLIKMRRIVEILDTEGDRCEAEKLGEGIWNDTQVIWYGLFHLSLDDLVDTEKRRQAEYLADIVESFQQEILISKLNVDPDYDIGISLLSKLV